MLQRLDLVDHRRDFGVAVTDADGDDRGERRGTSCGIVMTNCISPLTMFIGNTSSCSAAVLVAHLADLIGVEIVLAFHVHGYALAGLICPTVINPPYAKNATAADEPRVVVQVHRNGPTVAG